MTLGDTAKHEERGARTMASQELEQPRNPYVHPAFQPIPLLGWYPRLEANEVEVLFYIYGEVVNRHNAIPS
jgi:hypothetical protein